MKNKHIKKFEKAAEEIIDRIEKTQVFDPKTDPTDYIRKRRFVCEIVKDNLLMTYKLGVEKVFEDA